MKTNVQTLETKGVTFTINKKALVAHMTGYTLYDVYRQVSYQKEETYRAWVKKWNEISEIGVSWFGVQSKNNFQYTLGFTFTKDEVKYKAYITACNNYAYPIE